MRTTVSMKSSGGRDRGSLNINRGHTLGGAAAVQICVQAVWLFAASVERPQLDHLDGTR
jgi:hypothetical protein